MSKQLRLRRADSRGVFARVAQQKSRENASVRRKYHRRQNASSSRERAKPSSVVLYHLKRGGEQRPEHEQVLLNEVRRHYHGEVVTGHDLDVFLNCQR